MTPSPVQTADPSSAGCWIEGSWGHYADQRLCQIAEGLGWDIDAESKAHVDNYPHAQPDDSDIVRDLADEAEEWLNRYVAPEGYRFGWADGEFMLWSDADWQKAFEDYYGID